MRPSETRTKHSYRYTFLCWIGCVIALASPHARARSLPVSIPMPFVAADYALAEATSDVHIDLIVATEVGRAIVVLPGDGTGAFGNAVVTEVPGDTDDLVVADFDRDGKLDAALIGGAPGGLVIALGNGDGSFRIAHTPPGLDSAQFGATSDFDGDGFLDLVLVDRLADTLVPLRGIGDGTFEIGPSIAIPSVFRVAVGDFTHDGIVDLMTSSTAADVMLLAGLGDGTFDTPRSLGTAGRALHPRDLNADGRLDLAITTPSGLVVALSKTDTTFELLPPVPNDALEFLAATDIDGDGDPDLLTTSRFFSPLRLFENDGSGHLHARRSYYLPETTALALADLDGDGFEDAVTGRTGSLWLLRGAGLRGFEGPRAFDVDSYPWSVECADFDGDEQLDVAVSVDEGIRVLRGYRGGGLREVGLIPAPGIRHITATDFDGDGRVDLAGARKGSWVAFRNDVTGFGRERVIVLDRDATRAAIDDFDDDGDLDAAVLLSPRSDEIPGGVVVLSNLGSGFEVTADLDTSRRPVAIETGDFNGDGDADLAVLCQEAERLEVFHGDGKGSFTLAQTMTVRYWPLCIVSADFDRDGHDDIFVSLDRGIDESEPGYWTLRGTKSGLVLASGGDTVFIARDAEAIDFDQDGNLDIIVVAIQGFPTLLLGNGALEFEATPHIQAIDAFTSVAAGDLDNDGSLDIVVPGADSNTVNLIASPEAPKEEQDRQ